MRAWDSPKKVPLLHLPLPKENYRKKSGVSKDNSPRPIPMLLFACMLSVQCKFNKENKFTAPGRRPREGKVQMLREECANPRTHFPVIQLCMTQFSS